MAMRVCSEPGCPALIASPGKCAIHATAFEKRRGTRQQRGYGAEHDQLRKEWEPKVRTGNVLCARCRTRIPSIGKWDLGHDDHDRTKWTGPEHQHCNRAAGGRASHS